ncbi:F-actin-capping protein subunit beta [Aspergillus viridinutans]|uniref:F-actin-capping protein subunit beta n=1 Tax=Aspergillus viridinutans TaxID=75553 RepID=A0A9P3BYQ5_ASPVI|nr:F-actin-capping protein subunit beta [Aspergillus viridinutans]GIK02046.1 F-actin-capping protein subunit beta [Aspergillus viridinutans]
MKGATHHPPERPLWLIHTSGTGNLMVEDMRAGTWGLERAKQVDKIIIEAGQKAPDSVKTAIVCPPSIYGPGNQKSVQTYWFAEAALKRKKGFLVGEGKNIWHQVHIQDLSDLYLRLGDAAAAGGGDATWNELNDEGYCLAENGPFVWGGFQKPALSPLLAAVQMYIEQGGIQTGVRSASGQDRVWNTAFIAVLCIITLTNWDLQANALSGIPVVGLLVIYLALTRPPKSGKRASQRRPIAAGHIICPLAFRVVVTLFRPRRTTIVGTTLLGVAKSSMWYFLIQTAEYCSWSVTAAIATFSIVATRNPFTLTSNIQALSHLIASLFALGQVISLLPDKAKSKSALWICIVVYLVPYLINNYSIHVANSSVIQSSTHPIDLLIQDAKANFQALLERQSNSYTAAREEYRRRYGMEPPPGFESWYNFAKAHQSPIIDDFDVIYDRIFPFWSISGIELTETINRLQDTLNSDVWVCMFSAEEARTNCKHPHRSVDRNIQGFLNSVLADLRGLLPDVKFLVNHLDEPRVLLPSSSERSGSLNITNYSKRPVWDTLVKFCPSEGSKKADGPTMQTFGLPFLTDHHSTIDLCSHPEYRGSHGLLISPTSFPLIEGLVPILSTCSLSTMGDILYPSPAYLEPEFEYVEAKDISWDSKHNNLYWAGSTTAGTKPGENEPHSYLREGKGVVNRVKSSFLNSRLFDVAFTRILQCETRYCRDQRALFRTKSWADKDEALHSRLVFDIDGNGISGRYYKLLASRSAPLKQTLLREWHDDRLMPWIHYIPVSQSMEELPEMVMYFTSEAGQKRAREIAEQGREWFLKAFRKEDLTIYMYRVFLELARLQDPKRSARRA